MSEVHQWINRYPAPLPGNQVITQDRPGERIAKCISEIQSVITAIQGGDEDDDASGIEEAVTELAEATEEAVKETSELADNILPATAGQWQVLTWNGSGWVADWVRATG